jgi:hypothetical protein
MLTSIAAVPASTSRSPQLSVTIYSPNQTFCSWHPVITMECVDRPVDRAICANNAIRAISGTARWYPCR